MTDTAMGAAFARIGLSMPPGPQPEPAQPRRLRSWKRPDMTALADAALENLIARRQAEVANVEGQLADDADAGYPRGSDWRGRAGKSLHFRQTDLALANAEVKRRNRLRAAAASERTRAAKTDRARMFLTAATEILSGEELDRIWDKAREMYGAPLPGLAGESNHEAGPRDTGAAYEGRGAR